LGIDSFFHFRTVSELLLHFFDEKSAFKKKFLNDNKEIENMVNCLVEAKEKVNF
jgi:hypothetical protein